MLCIIVPPCLLLQVLVDGVYRIEGVCPRFRSVASWSVLLRYQSPLVLFFVCFLARISRLLKIVFRWFLCIIVLCLIYKVYICTRWRLQNSLKNLRALSLCQYLPEHRVLLILDQSLGELCCESFLWHPKRICFLLLLRVRCLLKLHNKLLSCLCFLLDLFLHLFDFL